MDIQRWKRAQALFNEIIDKNLDDREEFLREACGSDLSLYNDVLALLKADQVTDFPLDRPVNGVGVIYSDKLSSGDTVARYKILDFIGSGGMGEVFVARDTRLNRKVALKFLPSHLTSLAKIKTRFIREAQAAAALGHNNIVTIYEVAEHDGRPFIAMEYLEGETLRELMNRGFTDVKSILRIVIDICSGLNAAHQIGIVHRDIKPENIKCTGSGQVKILDFGIAKTPDATRITVSGSPLGTANYMSPEQAKAEIVDHRSDIFAVGVILHEMITGKPPFARDQFISTIQAVISDSVPRLVSNNFEIPVGLQEIIDRALAKIPDERYPNVKKLSADISILLQQLSTSSPGAAVETSGTPLKALAVLYLRNLGDPQDEYLCYGITEDLIIDLLRISSLRVAPMRSILNFKNHNTPLAIIAQKLKVKYVLDGTLHKANDTIRLSSQLIDIEQDSILWADRWEQSANNLPHIKRSLALQVSRSLNIDDRNLSTLQLGILDTNNSLAYEYYLRGKYTFKHKKDTQDLEICLGLYQKALTLDVDLLHARVGIAEVYIYQGRIDLAKQELEQSLESARFGKLKPVEGDILRLLAELYVGQSDWKQSDTNIRQSLTISREIGDLAGEVQSLGILVSVLTNQAQFDEALTLFERIIEINRRLQNEDKVGDALKNMGRVYRQKGDYNRAEELYTQALHIARQQENLPLEAACLGNLGNLYVFRDDYDAALKKYTSALKIDTILNNKSSLQTRHTNIAHILESRGEYGAALEHINKAISISKDLGDRRVLTHSLTEKSEIYLNLGDYEGSYDAASEALGLAKSIDYPQGISHAYMQLGVTSRWMGQKAEAEGFYRKALVIAEQTGLRRSLAWIYLLQGELHFDRPDHYGCHECFEKAQAIAEEIGEQGISLRAKAHRVALAAIDQQVTSQLTHMESLLSDAEDHITVRNNILVRRLMGQMMIENGTPQQQADGRQILEDVQVAAENKGLTTEMKLIRSFLKR